MATKGIEKLRADKGKHQTKDSDTYFCVPGLGAQSHMNHFGRL